MTQDQHAFVLLKWYVLHCPYVCQIDVFGYLLREADRLGFVASKQQLVDYGKQHGLINDRAEAIP